MLHIRNIEHSAHHDDLFPRFLQHGNVRRLCLGVGGVVYLLILIALQEIGKKQILVLGVLVKHELLHALVEFLVAQTAVLNEDLNIVPVFLVLLALVLCHACQAVGDFFGNVPGNPCDRAVVLQERTGNVQRHIGTVDHTFQEHQKFRNDLFDIVRDEHLIVVEFDLPLNAFGILRQFGEIQDAL